MIDLNNLEEINKLDPKNVYESTGLLSAQCKQIWEDAKLVNFPEEHKSAENIIICGMGGSAYGGHVTLSAYKDEIKVPLVVNNNYHLPAFANQKSLVILTSYSGSTEETLSCAAEALEKKCKIIVLSSGGKLEEFVKTNNLSALIFESKNNPSGQPRLGTGYIVLGTLAIISKLGFINLTDEDVARSIKILEESTETTKKNAQDLGKKLVNNIPVILGSEFLEGNAHIIRNQFNETSKSFSAYEDIPELNHHLMEGLKNPENKNLKILFLDSDLYSEIVKKRILLTKDVVSKNTIPYLEYNAVGDTKLSQILNVLSLGGYLTLYVALIYGLDPSLIPWVDYFKENLHK